MKIEIENNNPNQALWEKGDFTKIANSMRESSADLVLKLGSLKDLKVLDLGCGDGNTAIPAAKAGAEVLGVDIARNLIMAGNLRAGEYKLNNIRFEEGDASSLSNLKDKSFDLLISVFGAMFAPKPFAVAKEMVRVTKKGGKIIMANWIPGDPTLVAQILKICSTYTPTPPPDFVSPMLWGVEKNVTERFTKAGIPQEAITFSKEIFQFNSPQSPVNFLNDFKKYYGPTINAFEAAEKQGKYTDISRELENLFISQNKSPDLKRTSIPGTYLLVTVNC